MEPSSTAASGYAASKVAFILGGFIGGLMLSPFWQPAVLREKGRLMAAAATGGIAVGSSFVLGGMVARAAGLNGNDIDVALSIGAGIGITAVFALNAVANWFRKKENADIMEVAAEVRSMTDSKPAAKRSADRRPAAKKTVRRKAGT
jgi:hypothetical protein